MPFLRLRLRFVALLLTACGIGSTVAAADKPNLLVLTMDDMSCDSVGAYGCQLADTTPHMDRLAARSLRFNHAYVQVGNCMPSRNVLFSGLYPHNNRVEGFYQIPNPGYPVLADLMKGAGYYTAIRHKVSHSTPYSPYPAWDVVLDEILTGPETSSKNVASYGTSMRYVLEEAKQARKPFFANINVADPHKPFYAENGKPDPNVPSRIFTADEVPVPGFLFDDPEVRRELAEYYSTVRRGDDCVGLVLEELEKAGQTENTLIVFLSDHGMPLPFAKTQLYYHSNRTPWMVSWPGITKPGSVDDEHMISAVDLVPTLCEVLKLETPEKLDGRSFAPLLKGEEQSGRDYVVTEYNENAGGNRHPMRAVDTKEYSYIFNPWSNGTRVMDTATRGTVTFRRMQKLAPNDAAIAARLDLFEHRVPEEMFNYATDPDALDNLIGKPEYAAEQQRLTKLLEAWMIRTGDPMLDVFRHRDDPQVREAYMAQVEQEAKDRRASSGKGGKRAGKKQQKKKAAAKKDADDAASTTAPKSAKSRSGDMLQVELPETIAIGKPVTVTIHHKLPADLGEQALTVTLKNAAGNARIERKIVQAQGTGSVEVAFDAPQAGINSVVVAAYVGEDYHKTPDYVNSEPAKIRTGE